MKTDVRNSNGRTYDAGKMQQAFDEYKKKVDAGEAFGYLGNQDNYLMGEFTHNGENLSDVSHKITEINWDASTGEVFGKIELLDTLNGQIAQKLVETYGTLDIAPSSYGEVKDGQVVEVVQLNSFDIVRESAWPDAKVKPVKE